MKFQSKKNSKAKGRLADKKPDFQHVQNGSTTSNAPEFPMKPFKGTKSHLEECEDNLKIMNSQKKRKSDANSTLCNDIQFNKEQVSKSDPLKVMSKLEQFSDVWNDCPDIDNPKSSFEVVPNQKNESEISKKVKQLENINKRIREPEGSMWSLKNGNGEKKRFKEESTWETNIQIQNSHKNKSNKIVTKNVIDNKLKDELAEERYIIPGKYDSKLAEMKRKKAVQEQSQLHADQKNIIKLALSSTDSKQQLNKKVVFSDGEDNEETQPKLILEENKAKNQKLFDDDDGESSEVNFDLKINRQFKGKKGQKLLELQSKFASDSRFTFDSRFCDSESENEKDEISENLDTNEEKKRQLEILESIVKQPIRPFSETRRVSGKKYDEPLMVRFDPTREDHQKYLLKPQTALQKKEELKEESKKSKKERKSLLNVEESKPEVTSEKIYNVKEDLKEVLKKENKNEFSLLKLFGSKDEEPNTQQEGSENIRKLKYATKNPFKYDSSESESEEEKSMVEEKEKDKIIAKPSLPSWRTTFFFTNNDSRLKEAAEFLKGTDEPEGDQEFAEKRKMLKDFIRHKFKNNNRKKDPFKKKLGGVKKKVFHKKKGK